MRRIPYEKLRRKERIEIYDNGSGDIYIWDPERGENQEHASFNNIDALIDLLENRDKWNKEDNNGRV